MFSGHTSKQNKKTGKTNPQRVRGFADVPFSVIAYSAESAEVLRRKRNAAIIQVLIVLCVLAAAAALLWLPALQFIHARQEASQVETSQHRMASWPQGKVADEYHRAQAYNEKIANSGQATLGEFTDPFAGGGAKSGSKAKPASETDKEYRSLLNDGYGVMGTIRIPEISVRMPIYHGTSDEVLEKGAGHLYGTSLPIGGSSTNAVLSGHRGLPSALLFTRLDELRRGDVFYVQTLGRTLGYRVESINVIDPSDTHLYKIVPGRDLVTLMTCTPYGVNTQRLVITGTRQAIPDPIPNPDDAKKDPRTIGTIAALCLLVPGLIWAKLRRYKQLTARHAEGGIPTARWR